MSNLTMKSASFLVATSAVLTLAIQACGGGSDATAQSTAQAANDADAIEGYWESNVTIRDCASGAAIRSFKGANVFGRGGSISGTNSMPPTLQGPALGVWKRTALSPNYTATFRFFRYNPDGTLAGSQRGTRTLTLAADGNSMMGSISGQVLDASDTILQTTCGTEVTTRAL